MPENPNNPVDSKESVAGGKVWVNNKPIDSTPDLTIRDDPMFLAIIVGTGISLIIGALVFFINFMP